MLRDWEQRFPGRIKSIAAAMQSVTPSHLIDRTLFPFETLRADGEAQPDGDLAFDEDPCTTGGAVRRIDIASIGGLTAEDDR